MADLEKSEKFVENVDQAKVVPAFTRPMVDPPKLKFHARYRYLGVLTKFEAESWIINFTDFRFYHLWDPENSYKTLDRLPLVVVNRSYKGVISHWLVRTTGTLVTNKYTYQTEYKIETYFIERSGHSAQSLTDLIEIYENNPSFDILSGEFEIFPHAVRKRKPRKDDPKV